MQCSAGHAMHGWARTSPPSSLLFLPQAVVAHRSTLIGKKIQQSSLSYMDIETIFSFPLYYPLFDTHSNISLRSRPGEGRVVSSHLYSTQVSRSKPPGSWQEDMKDGWQKASHPRNTTSPSPPACLSLLLPRHCWLYYNRKVTETSMKNPRESSNLG